MQSKLIGLFFWLFFLFSFQLSASEPDPDACYSSEGKPLSDCKTETGTAPKPVDIQVAIEAIDPSEFSSPEEMEQFSIPATKVTQTADKEGRIIWDAFDEQDRVIATLYPDGSAVSYKYHDDGGYHIIHTDSSPKLTNPDLPDIITHYHYNPQGDLTSTANYDYHEDGSYRVTETPVSGPVTVYDYNAQGEMESAYRVLSVDTYQLPDMTIYPDNYPTTPNFNLDNPVSQTFYFSQQTYTPINTQIQVAGFGTYVIKVIENSPIGRKIIDGVHYVLSKAGNWIKVASIANKIAKGHAYTKHIGEFKDLGITTRTQLAKHIKNIIENPSAFKPLSNGRSAYWDDSTGTVVIWNPRAVDGGTAFRPGDGKYYFDFVLH